ncbi:hypothetical protein MIND_00783400 [Mycena indigotica]|uniref:Uncharacterized protein n=1 Tax=Mycena indigotica TaxID=2126181 RepID=A0A8H6SLW6_9AGAR|nr:uncharacterized protein MIND_00783400 [Mycena indigotica]KAF7302165.1 hypothetical protein MIND_00783400 [Mycena indigotica]
MNHHLSSKKKPRHHPYLPTLTPLKRPPPPPSWDNELARSGIPLAPVRQRKDNNISNSPNALLSLPANPLIMPAPRPHPVHNADLASLEGHDLFRAAQRIATSETPKIICLNPRSFTSANTFNTLPLQADDIFFWQLYFTCSDNVQRPLADVINLWLADTSDELLVSRPPPSLSQPDKIELVSPQNDTLCSQNHLKFSDHSTNAETLYYEALHDNIYCGYDLDGNSPDSEGQNPMTEHAGDPLLAILTSYFPPSPGEEDVAEIYEALKEEVRRSRIKVEEAELVPEKECAGEELVLDDITNVQVNAKQNIRQSPKDKVGVQLGTISGL